MTGSANIMGVGFYCVSSSSYFGQFHKVHIYATHTSLDQLTISFENNYDGNTPELVYYRDVLDVSWDYLAWNLQMFDAAFEYNGTENLLIEFTWDGTDGNAAYGKGWYPPAGGRVLDSELGNETGELRDYMNTLQIYFYYP
jgi:hypothetical protein